MLEFPSTTETSGEGAVVPDYGSRSGGRVPVSGFLVLAVATLMIGASARAAYGQAIGGVESTQESPVLRSDGGLSAQVGLGETLPATGSGAVAPAQEAMGEYDDARPYTLESAVGIALRNNRQLAVSQYDLDVANKQVSGVRRAVSRDRRIRLAAKEPRAPVRVLARNLSRS